ncbi:MAG TPA: polysaccharide deacetylase family protein [Abditibacteriaceae bacterium]|nr:polysaccharide deacetylase family protein [Abditibacteriaceae bacterium]
MEAIQNEEKLVAAAQARSLTWRRVLVWALSTAMIWSAYVWWRPPAPVLGLRHVEHLGHGSREVALTFDDAPHPLMTPMLLESLRRNRVPATFFCVSDGLRLYPELAARMVRDGHKLANHSHYHHNLTRVAPCEYPHEIADGFATISKLGGQTRLFRPPGGGLNRDVMQYLYDNDYTLAWWSNNAGDWTRPPAWQIANGTLARLRGGDILLLHDAGVGTPQALNKIVRESRHRGLQFVLMPEKANEE